MQICYALLGLQALLYVVILRIYLRVTGTWPDVGSNFLGFWVLAIVPGSLLLALMVRIGYRVWGTGPHRNSFLAASFLIDFVILLASLELYARHLHG